MACDQGGERRLAGGVTLRDEPIQELAVRQAGDRAGLEEALIWRTTDADVPDAITAGLPAS